MNLGTENYNYFFCDNIQIYIYSIFIIVTQYLNFFYIFYRFKNNPHEKRMFYNKEECA